MPATASSGGRDSSRIEGFSDAVFGFALTLLVVSLEVPRSFAELATTMEGFAAFAICFALIVWIWVEHFKFFRRFALADGTTIALNAALLFLVLFYVYPLKFLFTLLVKAFTGLGPALPEIGGVEDVRLLMRIYCAGFMVVFLALAALYQHAWRRREALGLDPLGRFDSRAGRTRHVATAGVGAIALAATYLLSDRSLQWAGWLFGALGPMHGAIGYRLGVARRRLEAELAAQRPSSSIPDL